MTMHRRDFLSALSAAGAASLIPSAFASPAAHPALRGKPWQDYANGHAAEAVFEAFKIVEIAVREAGGYPDTEYGQPMMLKAFAMMLRRIACCCFARNHRASIIAVNVLCTHSRCEQRRLPRFHGS